MLNSAQPSARWYGRWHAPSLALRLPCPSELGSSSKVTSIQRAVYHGSDPQTDGPRCRCRQSIAVRGVRYRDVGRRLQRMWTEVVMTPRYHMGEPDVCSTVSGGRDAGSLPVFDRAGDIGPLGTTGSSRAAVALGRCVTDYAGPADAGLSVGGGCRSGYLRRVVCDGVWLRPMGLRRSLTIEQSTVASRNRRHTPNSVKSRSLYHRQTDQHLLGVAR